MDDKKVFDEDYIPIEFQDVFDVVEEPKTIFGIVDCALLNVRTKPNTDAEILTVIKFGTEIMIDESESTEDFYKVCNSSGIEGFCMKKFVKIK